MSMQLLQVDSLSKSYGDRLLFADVNFGIAEGEKVGLIARNGMGKTTLLRCIAGREGVDGGSVVFHNGLTVGFLEQIPQVDTSLNVEQESLRGAPALEADEFKEYREQMRQQLGQLGLHDLEESVGNLSGGQRKRLALAKVVMQKPQLLILDEPTNHLDLATIEWMEGWLSRSRIALLMVTHDRYFLDRVCNKIIEIDRQQIYSYQGNYANYLRRRQERVEAMTAQFDKVRNTLRREQDWMNRQPQARAGKAKFRIDNYHSLRSQAAELAQNDKSLSLNVKSSYIGSKIFEAKHVSKRYGEKTILKDFNYVFSRYEKVGIIGANGVGKSTFVKMLQGLVAPDWGHFDIGETVKFGYYNQDGIHLDPNKKVIDAVADLAEDIVVNQNVHYTPSQFLQHFLFTPAEQQKLISKLSGGERARLYLASVLMRSPNFLILDEPTNDLDIVTLGILEDYLASFSGCVIVISHDRYFLDSIADHLFVFEGDGKVSDFPGSYTEYRAQKATAAPAEKAGGKAVANEQVKYQNAHQEKTRKLTFKEKRELEELTLRLEKLNKEKAEYDNLFNSGQPITNIDQISARYTELTREIDEAELRWLELSEIDT